MVIDPADGRIPPQTPAALARIGGRAGGRGGRAGGAPEGGRADSWLDRSLYDRCITRGLPGSMMPAIYGNAYDITQAPGIVAIRYEMIHETRIIRLDSAPRTGHAARTWVMPAVISRATRSSSRRPVSTPRSAYRNGSPKMKLTERFTPVAAEQDRLVDDG